LWLTTQATNSGAQEVLTVQTGSDLLRTVAAFIAGAIGVVGFAAYLYFIGTSGLTICARMKRVAAAIALGGLGLALLFGILGGWELLACMAPAIAFMLLCLTGSTYLNLRLRQRVARGHKKRLQRTESPWLRRLIERAIARDRAYFGEEQEREKEGEDSQTEDKDD